MNSSLYCPGALVRLRKGIVVIHGEGSQDYHAFDLFLVVSSYAFQDAKGQWHCTVNVVSSAGNLDVLQCSYLELASD